jgi:hypothetical protein
MMLDKRRQQKTRCQCDNGFFAGLKALLQLDFLVQHMLARFRIEFHEFEFFWRGAFVLAGGVKVSSTCGGLQFDLFADFASHFLTP